MHAQLRAFVAVALATQIGCNTSPTMTAAWNLRLTAGSQGTCSLSGASAAFGTVTADTLQPIPSQVGQSVSEWTNCVVASNTPGVFSMDATTEEGGHNGNTFSVSIPSISPSATEASPAVGEIFFVGPASGGKPVSGSCNFYFKDPHAEGVADHEIWVAYACPSLTVGDGSTCEATEGYIAYRNCALAHYM